METGSIIRKKNEFKLILEAGTNFVEIASSYKISELDAMKKMIDAISSLRKEVMIKFQLYEANSLGHDKLYAGYEYLQRHQITGTYEDYLPVLDYCKKVGVEFVLTAFDEKILDVFGKQVNFIKVASTDITNESLLRKINKLRKVVFVSTAGSTIPEIRNAYGLLTDSEFIPFHCLALYNNSNLNLLNLSKIQMLRDEFPHNSVGYSDHTAVQHSFDIMNYAYLSGARFLEKHFTLDRTLKGNDHEHSFKPSNVSHLISTLNGTANIVGDPSNINNEEEIKSITIGRRGIYAARDIEPDEVIEEKDLQFLRPGDRQNSISNLELVIGKKARIRIYVDDPITLEDVWE